MLLADYGGINQSPSFSALMEFKMHTQHSCVAGISPFLTDQRQAAVSFLFVMNKISKNSQSFKTRRVWV